MNLLLEAVYAMFVALITIIIGSLVLYGSIFWLLTIFSGLAIFVSAYLIHYTVHVRTLRQE